MSSRLPAVAVLDRDGAQSALGRHLGAAADDAGLRLDLRTPRELVAEVSVRGGSGRALVLPDRCLLWLVGGDPTVTADPSDAFVSIETTAAARSIADLSASPVLNRPTPTSACGRLPASAVAASRWASSAPTGEPSAAATVRPERFAGSIDTLGPAGGEEEVYDYATGRATHGRPEGSVGPFRARPGRRGAPTVRVRVVDGRAITPEPVEPLLASASVAAASRFGLDLCTLWWLAPPDEPPLLARADGWLRDRQLGADGPAVAAALVRWVARQQLADRPGAHAR